MWFELVRKITGRSGQQPDNTHDVEPESETAIMAKRFLAGLRQNVSQTPELPVGLEEINLDLSPIQGGMGEVWVINRFETFDRKVALKVLKKEYEKQPKYVQRFESEVQIHGEFDHPNIPRLLKHGMLPPPDGRPAFVMDYVEGETLGRLLDRRKDSDTLYLVKILRLVAAAVGHAHTKGVVHRDLKPANIKVGENLDVRVIDWGLAVRLKAHKSKCIDSDEIAVAGTPQYMPPEQCLNENGRVSPATDVFAIGAILCEVLSGKPLYTGSSQADLFELARKGETKAAIQRLKSVGNNRKLVEICLRCIEKRPEARFQDGNELAGQLAKFEQEVESRELRRPLLRRLQLLLTLTVLTFVTIGIGFVLQHNKKVAINLRENDGLSVRLSEVVESTRDLEAQLKSVKSWNRLEQTDWLNKLRELKFKLNELRGKSDSETFEVRESTVQEIGKCGTQLSNLEADYVLASQVDRLFKSRFLLPKHGLSYSFIGDLQERREAEVLTAYEVLIRDNLNVVIADATEDALVDRLTNARVPWIWIRVFDDVAMSTESPAISERLRQACNRFEGDEFVSSVRNAASDSSDRSFLKSLSTDPRVLDLSTELILTALLIQQDPNGLTTEILERAAFHEPRDSFRWLLLGYYSNDSETRRSALTAALARDPNSHVVRGLLGVEELSDADKLVDRGQYKSATQAISNAIKFLKDASTLAPKQLRSVHHFNIGVAYEKQVLIQEQSLSPLLAFAAKLGSSFQDSDSYDLSRMSKTKLRLEAAAHYQLSIDHDIYNVNAWNNLGTVQHVLGEFTDAKSSYQQCCKYAPSYAKGWFNLGLVCYHLGEPQEAQYCFRTCVELEPNLAPAHSNLGNLARDSGDFMTAKAHYQKAIELLGSESSEIPLLTRQIELCEANMSGTE